MPSSVYVTGGQVSTIGVLEPGLIRPDGDMSIAILSFHYEIDGVRTKFDGAINQSLTNNSVNYVFLDWDGSLNINTTGYPTTSHIRLGRVGVQSGLIVAIDDDRVILTAGLFKNIQSNKSEGQDSDTTGTPQEKLKLNLPDLEEGTYKIEWYCELRHSNNTLSEYAEMSVTIDDTFGIGSSIWPYAGWEDSGGFNTYDITSGSHYVDLDFWVNGGGTAYIRRARMMARRIA